MEMTISDYLKNPTGGRNHMLGQTDMAKAIYTDKFNKMMLKYAGKIKYFLFKKNDDTRYIILIKLPSEMKGFMNKLNWMDAQKFTSSALNELVMPCNKKVTQTNDMKKIQSATKKGSMTIATGDEDAGHLRFKANGATHMSKMVDKVKRSNSMISKASTVKTVSKVRKIGRK